MKIITKFTQALAICLIFLLSACSSGPLERTDNDQCLRAELFTNCLKSLPAGPTATKYNDWDEVVEACGSVAYYQSLRLVSNIKKECR